MNGISEKPAVSSVRTSSYEAVEIERAVNRHFELLGLASLITPGCKVAIKPNLLMKRTPEEATTTHPMLVASIAKKVLALGAGQVVVAESPGGPYTKAALSGIYQAAGYTEELAREYGFTLNTDTGWQDVFYPEGEQCRSFHMINPLVEADVILNVCKLKTHGMTLLSGGVKNLFGSIPGLQKPEMHYRFPDRNDFGNMLVDLCLCLKPAATFVDAVVSMEGDGPSGGVPKHTGYTFCSQNPFVLDVLLAGFMALSPEEVPTIQNAVRRGLCPSGWEQVPVVGDELLPQPFQRPHGKAIDFLDYIPKGLRPAVKKAANRWLIPKPVILERSCVGCGKCAESCPAKTIRVEERKAKIDYTRCIKCYCCHEMCPVKAIRIRRFKLFRF